MVLKTTNCLSSLLSLFLCLFFCIKPFQLIFAHIDELDSLCKLRMYLLNFLVYLLACNTVVRMTLWGRTQLYHVACFSQVHLDKIGVAIGKVDDILSFLRHSLGYFFVNLL